MKCWCLKTTTNLIKYRGRKQRSRTWGSHSSDELRYIASGDSGEGDDTGFWKEMRHAERRSGAIILGGRLPVEEGEINSDADMRHEEVR